MKSLFKRLLLLLIGSIGLESAYGQFAQSGAGPYDYNTPSNWTGSAINGVFTQTLTANQTVGFSVDTDLPTGLTFAMGGPFSESLVGTGGDHTINLEGDISVQSKLGGLNVTIGSLSNGQNLSVSSTQNAIRTITVGANDSLVFLNPFTTTFPVYKAGLGTLIFGGSSTCPVNVVESGTLILDCSTQTTNKPVSGANLGLENGTLELVGNSSAATTQTFNGVYLNFTGASSVAVTSKGQSTILNLGTFSRGNTGETIDFTLPVDGAIQTSASNFHGILGGFATVGKSTWASSDGSGNLVGLTSFVNTIGPDTNVDLISNQSVTSDVTVSTFRFNTGAPVTVNLSSGTNVVVGQGILVTGN